MILLPQAPEAEQALLSSFLIAPREIGRLCAEMAVDAAHFHIPANAAIYRHLLTLWSEDKPIDLIILTNRLRDYKELEIMGGAAYVTELFTLMPTARNAENYICILREKTLLRQIIAICHEYSARSFEDQHDTPNILASVQSRIAGLGANEGIKIPTMKENIMDAIDTLEGRVSSTGSVIPTGLEAFDNEVGPIERGNVLVIGGKTKSGKTILAGQMGLNIAMTGKRVLFISLEMTERELTLRLLSILARVDTRMVRMWNDHEHSRFAAAQKTLMEVPFHIVTRRHRLSEIVAVSQQFAAREGGLGAIVLDYAQLAEGSAAGKNDRRQLEIAEISRTAKRLAVSLNVLFILLTQLNDDGRSREARDIENDANLMVEVGHNTETGERGVKVVLARSAPSGQRLKLRIIPEHTRVEDAPDMNFEPEKPKQKAKGRNWHQD